MAAVNSLFLNDDFEGNEEIETPVEIEMEDDGEGFEPETETENEIEPEHEQEVEQVIQTEVETEQDREPRHIPIGAMLDERDKRKAAEAERAELQRQLDELQKAQAPAHDLYSDDPYFDQFRREQEALFNRKMFENRLADSDERARERHGEETVREAAIWAKAIMETDKTFEAEFLDSRRPMEMLVEKHQRDRQVSEMMSDPDAWALRRAAELSAATAHSSVDASVPTAATNKPASPTPPKSITSLTSQGHGTDQPKGRLSAVSSLFD